QLLDREHPLAFLGQLVPAWYPAERRSHIWHRSWRDVFAGRGAVVDHFLPCARSDILCWAVAAASVRTATLRSGEHVQVMAECVSGVVSTEQVPATGSVMQVKRRRDAHAARHVQATVVVPEQE